MSAAISKVLRVTTILCLTALLVITYAGPPAGDYFKITVVDEETDRGVPLVELKTTSEVSYYTDSNGIVAFHEPGLMNQTVYFHIRSHGYEFPPDIVLGRVGSSLNLTARQFVIL